MKRNVIAWVLAVVALLEVGLGAYLASRTKTPPPAPPPQPERDSVQLRGEFEKLQVEVSELKETIERLEGQQARDSRTHHTSLASLSRTVEELTARETPRAYAAAPTAEELLGPLRGEKEELEGEKEELEQEISSLQRDRDNLKIRKYLYLFHRHMGRGDFDRAQEFLMQALDLAPRDPGLLFRMAHVMLAQGDYRQAARYLEQAFQLDPLLWEDPYALEHFFGSEQKGEKVLAPLLESLSAAPRSVPLLFLQGTLAVLTEDWTSAKVYIHRLEGFAGDEAAKTAARLREGLAARGGED